MKTHELFGNRIWKAGNGPPATEDQRLELPGFDTPDNVISTDIRSISTDPKESPSTMGNHRNHSAWSYFRVGKALGDGMVKLPSQ